MVLLETLGKPSVHHVDKDVLMNAFNELQSLAK